MCKPQLSNPLIGLFSKRGFGGEINAQGFKTLKYRGAWVAQSVKRCTLDFGQGHDPRVVGWGHPSAHSEEPI